MSEKDTRATGAGSVAIGGSAKNAKISTHVSTSPNAEAAHLPSPRSQAGGVTAEGPAAVAIGGSVEDGETKTNFQDIGVGSGHDRFKFSHPEAAIGDGLGTASENALVDVLIIAALPIEYEAARDVAMRLPERVVWEEQDKNTPTPYLVGKLRLADSRAVSVALARPTRMGGPATLPVMAGLVERLGPRCLAMCGVCAGNPADVALGDVIIGEMVYYYDEGKRTMEGLEGDHRQVPMLDSLVRAAQELRPDDLPSFGLPSEKEAKTWLLERIYAGDQPREHPARSRYFRGNEWQDLVRGMESEGLVRRNSLKLTLTDEGKSKIEEARFFDVESPVKLPFAIKVGPIASGQVVVKDGLTWDQLKKWGVRSVLGLEMEAAALGATAARLQVPVWFVAKGVMDHADPRKDDRYKSFAARASAEVLFKFLSQIPEWLPERRATATPAKVKR
jgi:nucleoside phosphorylase